MERIARIVWMNKLNNRYRQLLGLDDVWQVKSVDLSTESRRGLTSLEHQGGRFVCPDCSITFSTGSPTPRLQGLLTSARGNRLRLPHGS